MLFRFSTLRLLCQNSMRRVLSPTFKQHGPCVETTSRQDNTHYVLQQHTGVLNLHPVMCIGVLYCPRCVEITHEMRYKCCFNTHSSKQHTMVTLMWVISTRLFLQCIYQSPPPVGGTQHAAKPPPISGQGRVGPTQNRQYQNSF